MRLRVLVTSAFSSLAGNRLRTALAVLGIVIGVGAVIAMLAIGAGAQEHVLAGIREQGSNLLFVNREWRQPPNRTIRKRPITIADAEAVLALPGVRAVSPEVQGQVTARRRGRTHTCQVIGITDIYHQVRNRPLVVGRPFTSRECEGGAPVAILGSTVADELFPDGDPLGELVQFDGTQLTVVGIFTEKDSQFGWDPNNQVYVPLVTALRGMVSANASLEMAVEVESEERIATVEDAIGTLMLRRHGIARAENRDFTIYSQQEILRQMQTVTGVFTALLGGIAAISLLVGGIGIMNIMLVSVTERTREIGVRKAVGATDADIRNQFLVEAVATTLVGGVAGILLGWGITVLAALAMPFAPIVTLTSIVIALLFSAAVGIFFGWYPARRAARLDPIEALRYE